MDRIERGIQFGSTSIGNIGGTSGPSNIIGAEINPVGNEDSNCDTESAAIPQVPHGIQ
jgi:hypothetical protein